MTDDREIVAAFADGERVGAQALVQALAAPEARAYLVDLLALRGLVSDAGVQIPAAAGPASPARQARPPARTARWLAAAAVLIVSLAGGFAVGWGSAAWIDRDRGVPAPPGSGASDGIRLPATPVSAPEPTRVIRFEPGVEWQESVGGN